ncbi:NCS2 family permease [Vibrio fortis]|uniref:NCS2 family permease n=1 Tax=Vibrio fortis TaxID=212667 RepID=UPI002F411696
MSESKTEILNQDANNGILEKFFKIKAHGSSVKNELVGGVTTFATMAYIIFVNPQIMAASGMDSGAVFVATCIGAAIGCLLMGLFANWPVGLAPGMGLNAFFSFTVVSEMGYSWEVALGAVFISGVLFVGMSFYKVRQWIIESIPESLRYSMTAGVGLFLGKVFGAVLIGILSVTLIGMMLGLVQYNGFFAAPPSLAPTFMAMDIAGALNVSMISVILAFLFVNMFDTAGTLMGVAERAHLTNPETGKIEGLSKALKADSISSVAGACVGCPPVTSYVESAAGVAAGARTGLSAIVVGALFLAAIFLSPLAGMIPAYATSGALIYVAFVMMSSMQHVDWKDFTNGAPAAITALMMPLTFSIANGIALGFITYTVLKLATGKTKDVSISMYFLAAIFIAKLVFIG